MSKPKQQALPKRALDRVHLGQSFAEYDTLLRQPNIFVHTPALNAAMDTDNPRCFFVGRRGTGKTTITRYVEAQGANVVVVKPEIFSPSGSALDLEAFKDANQRPFRSLTAAFRRTLQDEVILRYVNQRRGRSGLANGLVHEIESYAELDFDLRALTFIEELTGLLSAQDDVNWVRAIKLPKQLGQYMAREPELASRPYTLLVDAIDESWDGSDLAVVYLAAMMHACLEINSQNQGVRVLMFLRENIFERVRLIDTEFARLETCVVGLDWSREQLLEMVERRLNAPLTAKFALGGETWRMFFEDPDKAIAMVFDYCQSRPRDILTYCGLALDTAQSHKHGQILISDLHDARRRFSDSRLSDLGDEYQENFPQISLVLAKFYGLGQRWTLSGIEAFLSRVLDDTRITTLCATWIYRHNAPELLVRLLYDIGFFGLLVPRRHGNAQVVFRSLGPRDTTPPPIDPRSDIQVHPSYWDALDLPDVLVTDFGSESDFSTMGVLNPLPGAFNLETYHSALVDLNQAIQDCPSGPAGSSLFESLIGQVLELCFFRVLFNIEPQVRDSEGTVVRDWISGNRGETGFWEMVRHRFAATQVLFECKNYEDLHADDFHQAGYYMSGQAGRFVVIVFRGEIKNHYYQHIKRLSSNGGLVLLLNDRDLRVFVRQALNGKVKDSHLQDRFDKTMRAIS